jgi:hypothetical protein
VYIFTHQYAFKYSKIHRYQNRSFHPHTKSPNLAIFIRKTSNLTIFTPHYIHTYIRYVMCIFILLQKTSNLTIFLWKSSNLAISLNIGFIEVSIFCVSCVFYYSINSTKLVSLWYTDSLQSNLLFSSFVTVILRHRFYRIVFFLLRSLECFRV